MTQASFTPPQYARSRGISADKVINWITRGELRAVNMASKRGGRPRWVIPAEAIEAFEAARCAIPPVKVERKRSAPVSAVRFYDDQGRRIPEAWK